MSADGQTRHAELPHRVSSCDCLPRIREKLAPEHEIETSIVLTAGALQERTSSTINRRDNGRPERRRGKPGIFAHTFCPFCGVRYEREPSVPASDYSAERP